MADAYETLKKRFHEIQVEKEARLAKIAAKQQEFDALSEQINVLELQKKEIHEQYLGPEKSCIFVLDNEAGVITKALRESDMKSKMGDRDSFLSFDEVKEIQARVQ